jgi:hypothetical protein
VGFAYLRILHILHGVFWIQGWRIGYGILFRGINMHMTVCPALGLWFISVYISPLVLRGGRCTFLGHSSSRDSNNKNPPSGLLVLHFESFCGRQIVVKNGTKVFHGYMFQDRCVNCSHRRNSMKPFLYRKTNSRSRRVCRHQRGSTLRGNDACSFLIGMTQIRKRQERYDHEWP